MNNLVPVDGHDNLARDKNTGAIININRTEMQQARARKTARIKQRQHNADLSNRVDNIEQKLDMLIELLKADRGQ